MLTLLATSNRVRILTNTFPNTVVLLLTIPEISIESLDISRWSLEVLYTILSFFVRSRDSGILSAKI